MHIKVPPILMGAVYEYNVDKTQVTGRWLVGGQNEAKLKAATGEFQ